MKSNSDFIFKSISPLVSKSLKNYVYALCELHEDGTKTEFYIGRGKGSRCLQHLEKKDTIKSKKIEQLIKTNRFRIDILRHDLMLKQQK